MNDPRSKIRTFLEQTFLFEFGAVVTDQSDLFKEGIIDSYGYIELVKYLEKEFGVAMTDEELLSSVLVSLDDLTEFVARRLPKERCG